MSTPIVTIVIYREHWAAEYKAIAADLREALGDRALRVDHIGSTAVPTLCAKDIIDIQITVAALDNTVAERLQAAGYTTHQGLTAHRQDHLPPGFTGPETDWSKLFFLQRAGERRCNIHVRQRARPNQRYPLLVRDYLRADQLSAAAYGELKRRLAASVRDADAYPEVKDPVADLIYLAAERWALATQWRGSEAT